MNKKFLNLLIVFIFIGLSTDAVLAQRRVLGKPLAFINPVDCLDNENEYKKFLSDGTRAKSRDIPWLVISDRENNQTYSKPEASEADKSKIINFRDVFYVVDETPEWVKIVKANVDELRINRFEGDYGWIQKRNMLLWTSGLVDKNTKIHEKTFLLNKADDFVNVAQLRDKTIVKIYKHPTGVDQEKDRTIYNFYFVLKREGKRYLLAEEVKITGYNVATKLIGWVSSERCADWNTRIALEPNFDDDAFQERQANSSFQMKAYTSSFAAKAAAGGEAVDRNKIFWSNDPVGLQKENRASDGKRLKGGIMRFPMLSENGQEAKDIDSYRSGIIGEIVVGEDGSGQLKFGNKVIHEEDYVGLQEDAKVSRDKSNNYNVFFVVEGTQSMDPYKEAIKDCIKGIQSMASPANISFGCSVYRDVAETDMLSDFLPLTSSVSKVEQFIESTEFSSWKGSGNYPAMYYGMSQALKKGAFDSKDTNIIIMLGNKGDYRRDRAIKNDYLNHKTYIQADDIIKDLAKLDVHLYAIQCENQGDRLSRYFLQVARNFMLRSGLNVFNKTYGNQNLPKGLKEVYKKINYESTPPDIVDIDESSNQVIELENAMPGSLVKSPTGGFGSLTQIRDAIEDRFKVSHKYEQDLNHLLSNFYNRGDAIDIQTINADYDNISAGRFGAAITGLLYGQWNSRNRTYSEGDIQKSTETKYQLYTEVYIPKKIEGAEHRTVSYILFMPEDDLVQYIRMLKKSINSVEGSYDKKREALENMFIELVVQFSGDSELRDKDIQGFSISDVAATMQGVYNEGLELDILKDVIIKDLSNERKISDDQIEQLIQRFQKVIEKLESILRGAEQYEYKLETDIKNRYFWIAVKDAF